MTLEFSLLGEKISREFTVCGWYEGDQISHSSQLYMSQACWEQLKGNRTEQDFLPPQPLKCLPELSSQTCSALQI